MQMAEKGKLALSKLDQFQYDLFLYLADNRHESEGCQDQGYRQLVKSNWNELTRIPFKNINDKAIAQLTKH